jgi:hypothetical protein
MDASWQRPTWLRTPRDIGVGDTPHDAVRAALAALGEPYAREMAAGVERESG